jgi:hypothetical protein
VSRGMRIAAVGGGLLLLTQIVLLTIQLGVLRKSYGHIRSQDAKLARLYPLQRDTAESALPLLHDARGAIKPLSKQTRQMAKATNVLPDLAARTSDMVDEVIPTMRGTRQLLSVIFGRDVVGTLEQTRNDAHSTRQMVEQSLGLQRQSLGIQRQTLAIQKRALAILTQSMGIQRETLQHARNLDNKTGGGLTAP